MMNFKAYSAMCKQHNIDNPYEDEQHYNRAYGIVSIADLPLQITPKKHKIAKVIQEEVKPKKPKSSKPQLRPSIRKKEVLTDEQRAESKKQRQREYYRKKVGRDVREKAPQVKLSDLTPEQRKQRKNEQRKAYRERDKLLGKKVVRSAEQRKQRNAYFKDYYAEKKNDPDFMAKRAKNTANYRERKSA